MKSVSFKAFYRTGRSCTIEVEAQAWDGEEEGKKGRKVIWSDSPNELLFVGPVFELLGVRLKTAPFISLLQGNDEIRCFFVVDKDGLTWNTESSKGMGKHEWDMLDDVLASPSPSREIEDIVKSLKPFIRGEPRSEQQRQSALEKCERLRSIARSLED